MPAKKQKKSKHEITLINNPTSGDPQKSPTRLEDVTRLLIDQGLTVKVVLAKPKEAATKLARKAIRKGYRTIVVMGGDGTIEAVARAVVGSKVTLGIIPAGTENNIARCLGLPLEIEDACKLIGEGYRRAIDVGQVKTKKAGKFYFLEITAIGLIAALYPDGKGIAQGAIGNIGAVMGQFLRYRTPSMKVAVDGQKATWIETPCINVSGTPQFGQEFLIAPDAKLDDGLLDVSIFANMSKTQVISYLAAISGEKEASAPQLERYQVRKIKITTRPKQEIMADGVMLGKGKATIKVRKNALKIITPEPVDQEGGDH